MGGVGRWRSGMGTRWGGGGEICLEAACQADAQFLPRSCLLRLMGFEKTGRHLRC